jgi:5'-3' exonuclease
VDHLFGKIKPDYNLNVRHRLYLYGLDADLLMLGLLSHGRTSASCARRFGPTSHKGRCSTSLEAIKFYLLHLSLMHRYFYHQSARQDKQGKKLRNRRRGKEIEERLHPLLYG